MKTSTALILTFSAAAMVLTPAVPSIHAQAQPQPFGPPQTVIATRHDTSKKLKDIPPEPAVSTREDFEVKKNMPGVPRGQGAPTLLGDPARQQFFTSALSASTGMGFDGVGEGNPQFAFNVNYAPPDTTGEAGLTQYVQWVNTSFAVFDKETGTKLYGPAGGNTLWSGFGGDCATRNDGDPIVQYDQLADRWIMSQFSVRSGNYLQCVAVSQTSDALGAYHRYAFSYTDFPDYPKLAVWPDAYYITFNMFSGSSFSGGRVCAYDRAKMLQGLPATQVCYQSTAFASPLVSDLEGHTLPPPGTPNYMLTRGSSSSLHLYRFKPNFVTPASSTFTGPVSIPVASYTEAGIGIPQPGTTQKLDAIGDRLMYRLGYRNLGARESLTVNHSVMNGSTVGVRWYEIDITAGVPSVRQQATYSPDATHRWMGSVAMDHVGNIALGFSASSGTVRPSIRFAGREESDPLHTLSSETDLQVGTGSQTTGLARWGDYSSMSLDPVDDCTFWFTSEYLQVNGTFNWSTRVGSFKFPSCGGGEGEPPATNFTFSTAPSSRTVMQGQSTTFAATVTSFDGYSGSGTFSVTGLPANATGTFSPATYGGGSGSSTLTITPALNTPTGSFPVVITATDTNGTPTQSAIVTLVVTAAPVPDFTLVVSPTTRTVKRSKSTTYAVTVTPTGGFNQLVTLSRTGCPANSTCTFSPATLNGGGSSTLTIVTTNSTPRATSSIVITASSSLKTRSATVTLKVQ